MIAILCLALAVPSSAAAFRQDLESRQDLKVRQLLETWGRMHLVANRWRAGKLSRRDAERELLWLARRTNRLDAERLAISIEQSKKELELLKRGHRGILGRALDLLRRFFDRGLKGRIEQEERRLASLRSLERDRSYDAERLVRDVMTKPPFDVQP